MDSVSSNGGAGARREKEGTGSPGSKSSKSPNKSPSSGAASLDPKDGPGKPATAAGGSNATGANNGSSGNSDGGSGGSDLGVGANKGAPNGSADGVLSATVDDNANEWRNSQGTSQAASAADPYQPSTSFAEEDDDGVRPSELYGKFTWKIENFSEISKRELRSNVFEVGEYKWYILVYPQGCDVSNHLSLFLCVADYDKLLPGWSHFAQFTIAVVNKDPKKSKYSDTLHRFCKKEHDWGWKKFMELSKVLDGFTVSDTLVIKAQVQVIREKQNRPFRCLDTQYRRELVRVYLTNVEGICRRFLEERREKLLKLRECPESFREFWASLSGDLCQCLASDRSDSILKQLVKRFFNEKEVTSTLVMDALHSGFKALDVDRAAAAAGAKNAGAEPPVSISVDQNLVYLTGDVMKTLEQAANEALPPQSDDKDLDDYGKDSVERDERRLAELGRQAIEMFVLSHLYINRIEVAFKENEALKRQEALIREEEEAEQQEAERAQKKAEAERERRNRRKEKKQRKKERLEAEAAAAEAERKAAEEEKRAKEEEVRRQREAAAEKERAAREAEREAARQLAKEKEAAKKAAKKAAQEEAKRASEKAAAAQAAQAAERAEREREQRERERQAAREREEAEAASRSAAAAAAPPSPPSVAREPAAEAVVTHAHERALRERDRQLAEVSARAEELEKQLATKDALVIKLQQQLKQAVSAIEYYKEPASSGWHKVAKEGAGSPAVGTPQKAAQAASPLLSSPPNSPEQALASKMEALRPISASGAVTHSGGESPRSPKSFVSAARPYLHKAAQPFSPSPPAKQANGPAMQAHHSPMAQGMAAASNGMAGYSAGAANAAKAGPAASLANGAKPDYMMISSQASLPSQGTFGLGAVAPSAGAPPAAAMPHESPGLDDFAHMGLITDLLD